MEMAIKGNILNAEMKMSKTKSVKQMFSKALYSKTKANEILKTFVYLMLSNSETGESSAKKRILIVKSYEDGFALEINKPFTTKGSTIYLYDITDAERQNYEAATKTFPLLISLNEEFLYSNSAMK